MARIVLGLGTAHTPLLAIEPGKWNEYIVRDYTSRRLNLSDGSWLSYEELNQMRNGRYADITDAGTFTKKSDICQRALDRLGSEIAAADPDVVVIVTDDETELFDRMNTPAVSIYYGETIITRPRKPTSDPVPSFMPDLLRTYALDEPRSFPAMAGFARELIEGFIDHDVDVAAAAQVEKPLDSGFGHGIGFVETRIFGGRKIPVVPLLINTYYPPNAPRPSRCHDIGRVLRRCIEGSKEDLRVAVMASGGLSHFVVDEELDRRVIEGFAAGQSAFLRSLPVAALNSGSSEIRNWIVVAGAIEGMERRWLEYQPLYRTPAGTGIGVAFGVWA